MQGYDVVVGVDMSLQSPGVALRRLGDPVTRLMGFQQRKRESELLLHTVSSTLQVARLPYPVGMGDRWVRTAHLLKSVTSWIEQFLRPGSDRKVHIFIEQYALRMAGSSSVSKLCELGGAFRYLLNERGWTFSELSPASVKKTFAGNGRATKEEMGEAYAGRHGMPSLGGVLGVKSHQHPLEDMVDALAVLETGLSMGEGGGEMRGRKRGRGGETSPSKRRKKKEEEST